MALIAAAGNGNLVMVRELLRGGVDPNIRNIEGRTALMNATLFGHLEVVRELLAGGADPNIIDNRRGTALILAIKLNQVDIVKELLNHGADINHQDMKGITPLMLAIMTGSYGLEIILLNRGADPYIQDNDGKEAQDHAHDLLRISPNYQVFVGLLAKYGEEDPNAADLEGITNLMIAAANNVMRRVGLYRIQNDDINANRQDNLGNTALHYAVVNNHYDMTGLLLEMGADPNFPNNGGATPRDYAFNTDNEDVIWILENGPEQFPVRVIRPNNVTLDELLKQAEKYGEIDQYDYTTEDPEVTVWYNTEENAENARQGLVEIYEIVDI